MSRTLRLGLCAATLLAAAVPAGAQHVERLRPGRVQADSLRATDLATAAWGYVRLYRLDALPGRTYVLALRSADFDARLLVARGVGPLTDVVASDDDGGGGTDARLRFRPTQTGPFLVLVSAVPRDTARPTGGFRLAVHEVSERSLNPDRLALGDSVRGELNDRSAAWGATRVIGEGELEAPRPDLPVDVYDFRAHRGQRVRLRFDDSARVAAAIGVWSDSGFHVLAPDRSLRDGRLPPSTVAVTIPADGKYTAVVLPQPMPVPAAYTLRLEEVPLRPAVLRRTRVVRRPERDSLVSTDPLTEGRPYREWIYPAAAGERLTATLRSQSFDAYLEVGYYAAPDSFVRVQDNDDYDAGPGNRDAQITLTAGQAREYVIRAEALAGTGAYTLNLETQRASALQRLEVGRLIPAHAVRGALDERDARLEVDGSPYEHWIYRATRPGERIVVTLSSTDFDPVLFVGRMEEGTFREEWSNDDAPGAGQGKDARVVAVLPQPGEYVIRVNTFGPASSGGYLLRVDPAPGATAQR